MTKETINGSAESRPDREHLEDWLRGQVQGMIQELLEQEVAEFLGRVKSARRSEPARCAGYRNGYGKPGKVALASGPIRVRRPRVRDTEEQFENRLLPLFVHRSRTVAGLIPELCLHGLSEGNFDLALRGLLGEDATVSASTVARLKDQWNAELAPVAQPSPGRPEGGLPVGGRGIREGRPGEGQGGGAGGAGGVERRREGGGERGAGPPGIDEQLVGGAVGPAREGDELSQAGGGGRAPGRLGCLAQRPPGGGGAALLEPQDHERTGPAAQEAAG